MRAHNQLKGSEGSGLPPLSSSGGLFWWITRILEELSIECTLSDGDLNYPKESGLSNDGKIPTQKYFPPYLSFLFDSFIK